MPAEPETLTVTLPPLFGDFTEPQTRGQRRREAVTRLKYVVKWLLNWKGIRNK
jgi:hypothetical protein